MVGFISKNFIAGLVTILPVALTVYLLYWLAVTAERALGGMIRTILPDDLYWPGMGLITSLVAIFAVGLLMHAYVVQRLFAKAEQLLYHMPVIKTLLLSHREFQPGTFCDDANPLGGFTVGPHQQRLTGLPAQVFTE